MARRVGLLIWLVLLQPGCALFGPADVRVEKPKEDAPLLPNAESAQLCKAVAETLANQGHLREAIEQLNKARSYDAKADVSGPLARLYARVREDQAALDEFRQALAAHPQDAGLYNDRGYFQYERGNWAEAEKDLRKATELAPTDARAWMNLGLALGQQSKYDESLAAFEKAGRPAEARCNLGFVYCTQGKFDQAKGAYREALKLDPGLKLARQALAKLEQPPKASAKKQAASSGGSERSLKAAGEVVGN